LRFFIPEGLTTPFKRKSYIHTTEKRIMRIKEFYIADARESPGIVYRVQDGREHIYYRRPRGNIYSIAFSQDGTLHFVMQMTRRYSRL